MNDDCCRLQFMAQRHFEQKMRIPIFKASEKSRRGRTCNRSSEQRKREKKAKKNAKNNSERGDCIRWITKSHSSFCEIRAHSNMNQHKTGKGKGRPRSPSPTGSPHRKSNGDGGAQGSTPKLIGKNILKRENWDLHLDSFRQDPKISEIQTLQYSRKDLSNGPCAWKKLQGHQLGLYTRTCTQFRVHILRVDIGCSNRVPVSNVSSLPMGASKERERELINSLWTQELHFT